MNHLLYFFQKNPEKSIFNLIYKNHLKSNFNQSEVYKFCNFFHNFYEEALHIKEVPQENRLILENDSLYVLSSLNNEKNIFHNINFSDLVLSPIEKKTFENEISISKILFIIIKHYAK